MRIGQTFAHYRVIGKLGEGGMGEVYRASDTKLDREVAIKVLPEELSADEDRAARFERERIRHLVSYRYDVPDEAPADPVILPRNMGLDKFFLDGECAL